jgi:hypothetical protein
MHNQTVTVPLSPRPLAAEDLLLLSPETDAGAEMDISLLLSPELEPQTNSDSDRSLVLSSDEA